MHASNLFFLTNSVTYIWHRKTSSMSISEYMYEKSGGVTSHHTPALNTDMHQLVPHTDAFHTHTHTHTLVLVADTSSKIESGLTHIVTLFCAVSKVGCKHDQTGDKQTTVVQLNTVSCKFTQCSES